MSRVSTLSWHVEHSESTEPTNLPCEAFTQPKKCHQQRIYREKMGVSHRDRSTPQSKSESDKIMEARTQARAMPYRLLLLLSVRAALCSGTASNPSTHKPSCPPPAHLSLSCRHSQGVDMRQRRSIRGQRNGGVHAIWIALLDTTRIIRAPQSAPSSHVVRGVVVPLSLAWYVFCVWRGHAEGYTGWHGCQNRQAEQSAR